MDLYPCSSSQTIQDNHSILPSCFLFAAGLLGNVIALFILWQHKLNVKNKQTSVFYILVTGLTIVNLTGKIVVCPIVVGAYLQNQTLIQLADSPNLCNFFAFCMTFFGLAPTLILLAMAVDCWLALAHPFSYHEHITRKVGLVVPIVSCVFSIGLCSLPFFGIGKFVQYCPGTWCFLQMTVKDSTLNDLAYSIFYGTLMGLLVLAIIICNVAIMRHLYKMSRRQYVTKAGNKLVDAKQAGMEELDHLILLAVMTILFAVCTLPLTGRSYVGVFTDEKNEYYDLTVLRLLSMNSIVDPWIFIICRTSTFYSHINALCSRLYMKNHKKPHLLEEKINLNL